MAEYRSPSGEVLDIPDKGVSAIEKLGWKPVKAKAEKEAAPEEKPRRRRKSE